MLLGVIADDFTGATDIAGFLVEHGMRAVQLNGVPDTHLDIDTDAIVISLKSRSCPAEQAIQLSIQALNWLKEQGCQQFYFKYCSTFDSTEHGNIGPVTDALLDALNESFTIVCPALPVNGRTVFNGHLFVYNEPLNESGMRHHPVTPMTDSSVVRLMERQSRGSVGLINYLVIEQGVNAVTAQFEQIKQAGQRYAVVDAINHQQLAIIGQAAKELKLITGGSGLAASIAQNWSHQLAEKKKADTAGLPIKAKTIVLSGSCSLMTNQQVAYYQHIAPSFEVDIHACLTQPQYAQEVCQWVLNQGDSLYAPMVFATVNAQKLHHIQEQYGAQKSSEAVEHFFSQLAVLLHNAGIRNFIVAGGETSGTVTQSLNVQGFHIGPQIAPGVPWITSLDQTLSLALKSGNFGQSDFFKTAQDFYL